jgi:selenium-binding protein 1
MSILGKTTIVIVALACTVAIALAQHGGYHDGHYDGRGDGHFDGHGEGLTDEHDDGHHDGFHNGDHHGHDGERDEAFIHGISIDVDGEDYYLAGAPDGPDGEIDIPGHSWVLLESERLIGRHHNTGPFGQESWWSSDADDGELLYTVHAVIDEWSEIKAIYYIAHGYVHYHELARVSDGKLHPSKVVWLKHIAQTHFTLDGGPHPELTHEVTPGLDLDFIPNALNPYAPEL